jgi:hypothetical protein
MGHCALLYFQAEISLELKKKLKSSYILKTENKLLTKIFRARKHICWSWRTSGRQKCPPAFWKYEEKNDYKNTDIKN